MICNKCGIEKEISLFVKDSGKKLGYRNTCKKCRKIYLSKWNNENKDKIKKSSDKYLKNNPETRKESSKKYYEKNKKKIQEKVKEKIKNNREEYLNYNKKWYFKNRDKLLKKSKKYREINKKECNKRVRGWKKTFKGKLSSRVSAEKRRAQILKTKIEPITREDILNLLKKQNFKCAISGKDLTESFQIDHIKPLSKGGTHTLDNIQLLTKKENLKKGAKWKSNLI